MRVLRGLGVENEMRGGEREGERLCRLGTGLLGKMHRGGRPTASLYKYREGVTWRKDTFDGDERAVYE